MTRQPNSRESSTGRRKSFNDFMPQDSRRRAGITPKLLEIKGYEVFRVDTRQGMPQTAAAAPTFFPR
jgi:hypothetical protein